MKKLILKCGLSPGDIVMLTAAVRDLHYWYPKRFLTDVRTSCPDLWQNNPYLTRLCDDDPEAQTIDCRYPLIDYSNQLPFHALHGFIDFLNQKLQLQIQPTKFGGDLHLSAQEKAWFSQVHEVTGRPIPFWIVAAGGKYDVTIKWWHTRRYQQVVDHFRGRIQFVQVGNEGHHHPRLEGVIDLRGATSLRELVRLVYHSEGILCSVTALMHLAAAVPCRRGRRRACVVVAGGREPPHWEAYPGHQFIHTIGALRCCAEGGCWKDRTLPLRDGDSRDQPGNRCVHLVDELPRCMDLISSAEVIRRIETYFRGGLRRFLSPPQRAAAQRGVLATARNRYDEQALNLHSAGRACDRFVQSIGACPSHWGGRGIVVCGGGAKYFANAWVCIRMLRHLGCQLPVELWHLGPHELDARMEALIGAYGAQCKDASKMRRQFPVRLLGGWQLKPYAILYSAFRHVLLLDADNVCVVNPEFLFETPELARTGAIFWPDYAHRDGGKSGRIWKSCGLRRPAEPEFESGQIVVDKQRCWPALRLSLWFNENSDFYYQFLHGDKETFHLGFRKTRQPYALISTPIHTLPGVMCQHDFQGRRIFQHRNMNKWSLTSENRRIPDFWFEDQCRQFLTELKQLWDGTIHKKSRASVAPIAAPARTHLAINATNVHRSINLKGPSPSFFRLFIP